MSRRGVGKHCVLAAALGVTEGAVSRWCQGGPMSLANAIALCEYLEVSADWLLLGRGGIEAGARRGVDSEPLPLRALSESTRRHLSLLLRELDSRG
ncbi:helix-turn-helix transcriptional regulator [Lysobacter spongiae]|uniref:Helix-turn-helix transcriptional regulator n=2 Tax=Marilutibacter spongiae TaxID=2025720 RepID=A0A7W3TM46_9GAMM|nr:helix-turn-helix transcriptional regulator [Lysobacter spongiae]MBB1060867.1 helix-turn-helix transcriptional regulator [Lysobacter spongiae]